MRGKPTNAFLAGTLRTTAKFLKSERRPTAAKWVNLAADRLEYMDCLVRCKDAEKVFLDAMEQEIKKQKKP